MCKRCPTLDVGVTTPRSRSLYKIYSYMPENKRHQAPEGSFSPLFLLQEKEKPARGKIFAAGDKRKDGRSKIEIRPLSLNLGVNAHATGSAYMELGRTKVFCTIYGPKELRRREDVTEEGQLTCDFKFAPFSCTLWRPYQQDQQEKTYSEVVSQALQRVLNLKSFERLQLEVDIVVLENGGSALAVAITCASVALSDAGVEMLDLPVACSVSEHTSGFLIDPTLLEEFQGDMLLSHPSISGSLTMAYLPSLGEVTAMKQRGLMTPDKLRQATDFCVEGCVRLHRRIKEILKEQVLTSSQSKAETVPQL